MNLAAYMAGVPRVVESWDSPSGWMRPLGGSYWCCLGMTHLSNRLSQGLIGEDHYGSERARG